MKKLLTFLLLLAIQANAQCDCGSADVTLPAAYPGGNYTFEANKVYCVNADFNMGWNSATFEDNVTICIQSGVNVTINGAFTSTDSNNHVTWNIGENASFSKQNFENINFQLTATIANGGSIETSSWASTNFLNDVDIDIASGGTLSSGNTTFNQDASVTVNSGGSLTATSITYNTPGEVLLTNAGTITASSFTVNSSVTDFTLANTGSFSNSGGFTYNSTGEVLITNGGTVSMSSFTVNSSVTDFTLENTGSFSNSGNYNFNTSAPVTITNDNTFSGASFQGGNTYGADINFTNTNTVNLTNGSSVELGLARMSLTNSGDFICSGTFDWGSSNNTNYLYNSGTLTVPNTMTSEDSKLAFYNYEGANFTLGNVFSYGTDGPNVFENYGTFNATELQANDPTLQLKNEGDITINIYTDTSSSVMSNCGDLEINNFFALKGKIINTGNYISGGTINFNSDYATLENYSMMSIYGINISSGDYVLYNEGEVDFTNTPNAALKLAGPGSSYQPEHSTSTAFGLFTWPGTMSNQSGFAEGNLNFVTTTPDTVDDSSPNNSTSMFGQWNSIAFDDTVVFGECSTCTVVTEYDQCANADGTWPVVAPDPNEAAIHNTLRVNRHIRTNLKN